MIFLSYFLYHYYNLIITFVHWTLGKYNYRVLWYHFFILFGSIQLKYSNQALRSFRCFPYYVMIILSFILSIRTEITRSILFDATQPVKLIQSRQIAYSCLTFRHRASCILGQAFQYSPENAFYIFNRQIHFII